jgi:hypothetical protein
MTTDTVVQIARENALLPITCKHLAGNVTQVNLPNGARVVFSYETPVCFTTHDGRAYHTTRVYSSPTARHINAFKDTGSVPLHDAAFRRNLADAVSVPGKNRHDQ